MRRLLVLISLSSISILGVHPALANASPACTITGTAANETITGTEGNDVICTGGGNDTVNALGGNDIILVSGSGIDAINGGSGNDTIDASLGTDSTIDAGSGDDTVYGTPGDDEITAGDGSDTVDGNAGDDTITGGDGNDTIDGDTGNDTVTGDTGNDTITGGDGNDTLNGTAGDDSLIGGAGSDNLTGGLGTDTLEGNSGDDVLLGESGPDALSGSDGNDALIGGSGVDSLDGGAGLNACDYEATEVPTSSCRYDDKGPVLDVALATTQLDVRSGPASVEVSVHSTDQIGAQYFLVVCSNGTSALSATAISEYSTSVYDVVRGSINKWSTINRANQWTSNYVPDVRNVSLKLSLDFLSSDLAGTYTCQAVGRDLLDNLSYVYIPSITLLSNNDGTYRGTQMDLTFDSPQVIVSNQTASIGMDITFSGENNLTWASINCATKGTAGIISIYVSGDRVSVSDLNGDNSQYFITESASNFNLHATMTLRHDIAPGPVLCYYSIRDSKENSTMYSDQNAFSLLRSPDYLAEEIPTFTASVDKAEIETGTSSNSLTFSLKIDSDNRIGDFSYTCYAPGAPWAIGFNAQEYYGTYLVDATGFTRYQLPISDSRHMDLQIPVNVRLGWAPGKYQCNVSVSKKSSYGNYNVGKYYQTGTMLVTRTPAGLPGAPNNLSFVYRSSTSGLLTWSAPDSLGSPNLIGYKAQISLDGSGWSDVPNGTTTETQLLVTGLQAGVPYYFRVLADNGVLVGENLNFVHVTWSSIQTDAGRAVTPFAPTRLQVEQVTNSGFILNWVTAVNTSSSATTDYNVEVSRDNGLTWRSVKSGASTSTSLTVSGAAPGTTYLVRVAAVNAVGQSEWLVGSVTTLATTASVPRSLASSNLGTNSLSLGWGLPDSNGGAAITNYQVEVTSNGSNSWTVIPHTASNQLGFNVSNLLSGRTYQFRVAAITSVGLGAYSNVITVNTLGGITPNAPAGMTVGSVKTNAASLSWSSVVATSKVTNYLVDVSTDGTSWVPVSKKVSTSTSLGLSGLKLGTTYQVRVAAVNANGTGDYVYGSFTTLATVSTSPTGLASSGVSGSGFTLNWNAPTTNGGSAITDYVVEINGGGYTWSPIAHDASSNTSITVTGLNPGVKYSVRVKAVNSVGISKASSNLNVTTLAVAPSAPVISLKSVSATGAVISWTAPNNGGAKISDYLAEVSTDNGQTWKTVVKGPSSSTSLTLKGLKTKTSYLVRISAKNSVGYSNPSDNLGIFTS